MTSITCIDEHLNKHDDTPVEWMLSSDIGYILCKHISDFTSEKVAFQTYVFFNTKTCALTWTCGQSLFVSMSLIQPAIFHMHCTVHMRMLHSNHHVIFNSVEVLPVAVKVHPVLLMPDLLVQSTLFGLLVVPCSAQVQPHPLLVS